MIAALLFVYLYDLQSIPLGSATVFLVFSSPVRVLLMGLYWDGIGLMMLQRLVAGIKIFLYFWYIYKYLLNVLASWVLMLSNYIHVLYN